MNFLIVSSGYNCQHYVKKCVDSVSKQTYQNIKAVFISDGSMDNTNKNIFESTRYDNRFIAEIFPKNEGAAKRRFDAIKKYSESDEDIVLLLGLDDSLELNALETIKQQYESGKWMTYGNWRDNMGRMLPKKFDLNFSNHTHHKREYRQAIYRSTAPNTFKRFLFDQLTEEDFKVNGKWILATTESNLMFSCLEMCGKERIGVITDAIYLYNRRGRDSTKEMRGILYQLSIYNEMVNRPKKKLLIR